MPSDALPDDPETLNAMLLAERVQNERLRQIIKELQRHRFGRRAETLPEDQMLLGLEDVEQAEADRAAQTDDASPSERQARAHKRRINRGALPGHLPRIEVVVDIEDGPLIGNTTMVQLRPGELTSLSATSSFEARASVCEHRRRCRSC